MLLNLPATIEGSALSPRSLSYLHNMYNLNGVLVPREGMEMKYGILENNGGTNDFEPRGMWASADGTRLYAAWNQKLRRIDGDIPATNLATIAGSVPDAGYYKAAVGYTDLVIAGATTIVAVDTSTDAVSTTMTGSYTVAGAVDIEYVDGRYLYITGTDSLVYWSEVNDPLNVDALSFFDAESRPDTSKALAVIGNDLYILGDRSIERFRSTGSATTPFQRITNSVIAVGYVGGMIKLSDSIVFIGREVGSGIGVYELSGSQFNKISNPAVDELLNVEAASGITRDNYELCWGGSWDAYGRPVICLSFRIDRLSGASGSGVAGQSVYLSSLSLYAVKDSGAYKWGFLGDSPENGWSQFDQWGVQDFTVANTLVLIGTKAPFIRGFNFISPVFFDNEWLFQRGVGRDHAGIYKKTESDPDSNQSEDFNYTVSEPFSCGFRSFIRDPEDRDGEISSIELSYSKQGAFRQSSNANPSGGDSNDVFNLRTSLTGVGWGYYKTDETEGRDWSSAISVPFGDQSDQGRIQFQKTGGIGAHNGTMCIIVESSATIPRTIEKVVVK